MAHHDQSLFVIYVKYGLTDSEISASPIESLQRLVKKKIISILPKVPTVEGSVKRDLILVAHGKGTEIASKLGRAISHKSGFFVKM